MVDFTEQDQERWSAHVQRTYGVRIEAWQFYADRTGRVYAGSTYIAQLGAGTANPDTANDWAPVIHHMPRHSGTVEAAVGIEQQFPIGSHVRDGRYGEAVFEVEGYWRGDLRLKLPEYGTTHCCPLSLATKVEAPVAPTASHDCDPNEDGLEYVAHIGAPGYGEAWKCRTCGRPWVKIGAAFYDPNEHGPFELSPADCY